MRRRSEKPGPCNNPCAIAIGGLLEVLARPWTMHILYILSTNGPTRFGALRRQVEGISSRVLTQRLRGLEEKGVVYREYEPTIPPAVTYGITNRMKDIKQVLDELSRVAQAWHQEDVAQASTVEGKSRSGRYPESRPNTPGTQEVHPS
jgi:DNA-binding HxlR family transcriptional regulator